MRSLNKIVFVNSANTPYAEIKLDGNVHFIGTQGVGKSTILRAILFFYNGDKLKLGIPKEKKGFDDFYLPHSNSYIVYEVAHEYGPFCVLVFRNQGRACFRFIDAAFDRSYLVDEMTGDVTSEYTVIRKRLEGKWMSRIIDHYDEYRNIIYGNRAATEKEFYRFALLESAKYQNIPRSLQNVFLNSRVDADFIKEIIIRSMNDDEVNIDLGYFRAQVAEFEQEYNDINSWFKAGPKGVNAVRAQADSVIKLYRQLLYRKEHIAQLYGELLYALRLSRERVPYMEAQIQKAAAEIQRLERLLSEEQKKFDGENADLNRSIGAVEDKLRTIKRKRKEYDEMDIASIVERVGREQIQRDALDGLVKRKELLTSEFQSLSSKYDALQNALESDFRKFEAALKEQISAAKENFFKKVERSSKERDAQKAQISASFEDAFAQLGGKFEAHRQRERELDREFVRLQYFEPLKEKMDAEREKLGSMEKEKAELESEMGTLALKIDALTREFDAAVADAGRTRDEAVRGLNAESEALGRKVADIGALLESTSGSLYEWLDANRPEWEKTFGKVLDENKILYRKGLKPVAAGGAGDTIFGVSIDLSDVESTVRTPQMLRSEKEMFMDALAEISDRIDEALAAFEKEKERISAEFSPKMKLLRERRSVCEVTLQTLPGRIKACQTALDGLMDTQNEMRQARKEELGARKGELAAAEMDLAAEKKQIEASRDKQLKGEDRRYEEGRKAAENERDARIGQLGGELQERRAQLERDLLVLKNQRNQEFAGAGVDADALNDCELSISKVSAELAFIENNRRKAIGYDIDCRDLFDHEEEFKDYKRALDEKRSQLESRFDLRSRNLSEKKAEAERGLTALRSDKKECEEGIAQTEDFQSSDSMFPSWLSSVVERTTMLPALSLVGDLKNEIFENKEARDRFKQAVNLFKGNFGPGNTFNFRTNVTLDEDYMDYASSLEEFVEQNKIEDYRGRTSDRYLEILSRVSREMGEIMRSGSEVEKTIRDINFDFKEKNFVGAIKSIEIRRSDSGDKMVQLLLRIKEFSDENQFRLAGVNLFSDADDFAVVNRQAVGLLHSLMSCLSEFAGRQFLTLSDTFQLQFRVVENDNDTGWVEKIANVGSDGTDILVKAMVNIMLINVFKEKVSRKFGDFRIHCVMDEIGKLHPSNVKGILDFANARNILLINSSPTTYNVSDYRYTYLLSKDEASRTSVVPLITKKEFEHLAYEQE